METIGISFSLKRCVQQMPSERIAKNPGTFGLKRLQNAVVCGSHRASHAWAQVVRMKRIMISHWWLPLFCRRERDHLSATSACSENDR